MDLSLHSTFILGPMHKYNSKRFKYTRQARDEMRVTTNKPRKYQIPKIALRARSSANAMMAQGAFAADSYYCQLKWNVQHTFTSTLGVPDNVLYRLNSPRDPEFAIGGTSALGFATLAAIYTRYRCYGSKIKVTPVAENTAFEIAVQPTSDGYSSVPSPQQMQENPRTKFAVVQLTGNGVEPMELYSTMSALLGVPKSAVNLDDGFSALTSADPARPGYWYLTVRDCTHTATITVQVYIEITYFVKFEGRRPFNAGA